MRDKRGVLIAEDGGILPVGSEKSAYDWESAALCVSAPSTAFLTNWGK